MSLDMSGNGFAPLGFGFMRLPEVGTGDAKTFDHEQICAMVDEFMAAGFTYFDTAYGYHNGKSECELKAALVDRYPRESLPGCHQTSRMACQRRRFCARYV